MRNSPYLSVFGISRILGVFPFGRDGNFKPILGRISLLGTITDSLAFPLLLSWYCYDNAVRGIPLFNLLLVSISGFLPTSVHILICLKRRREFEYILNRLGRFEKTQASIAVTVFFMVTAIARVVLYEFVTLSQLLLRILLVVQDILNLTNLLVAQQFGTYVETLKLKMRRLRKMMTSRKLRHSEISLVVSTSDHFSLLELAKLVNSLFSVEMFCLGGQVFCYFVQFTAYLIIERRHCFEGNWFPLCYSNFIYISCKLAVLVYMTVGEKFNREAEAFNKELFKMMMESDELCKNDQLRLYVTMKQTVNFTACGFFSLGYPLVTSVIAAVTTYLVILIQFTDK